MGGAYLHQMAVNTVAQGGVIVRVMIHIGNRMVQYSSLVKILLKFSYYLRSYLFDIT
jgi:hypothetical protein